MLASIGTLHRDDIQQQMRISINHMPDIIFKTHALTPLIFVLILIFFSSFSTTIRRVKNLFEEKEFNICFQYIQYFI